MTDLERICKTVSQQLNEDPELVRKIGMYLFEFIKKVMTDPEDTHDILLHKLFRFKLKPRFKENKQAKNSPK